MGELKKIAIIGLGYVGQALARAFLQAGFSIVGVDKSEARLRELRELFSSQGMSSSGVNQNNRGESCSNLYLELPADPDVNCIIVAVPTPTIDGNEPDYSMIDEASSQTCDFLRKRNPRQGEIPLVCLESTVGPGTTRKFFIEKFEKTGLILGVHYLLAYSPERVDPGNETWNLQNTPKIVAGADGESLGKALVLYKSICSEIVTASSMEVAESAKLLENTYRLINISFVNEMNNLLTDSGIDFEETLKIASTKPFGFQKFHPGAGVGGHCIPEDPVFLNHFLKEFTGRTSITIDSAFAVDKETMNWHILSFESMLRQHGIFASRDLRIGVFGVSYKPGINDIRNSPGLKIVQSLISSGHTVFAYDPVVRTAVLGERSISVVQKVEENLDASFFTFGSEADYNIGASGNLGVTYFAAR